MEKDLVVNPRIKIPLEELRFSFVRSSGPGGQRVNKVSTKAVLRWAVASTPSLPDDVRQRLEAKYRRRISAEGDLVITSQRYRDQHRNIDDCLDKLRAMLCEAATPPKKRKPTRPTKAAKERRLKEKRRASNKKQQRSTRPTQEE